MEKTLLALTQRRPSLGVSLIGYVGGLLLVTAATLIGLLISARWGNSPVVLLYLPAVLGTSIYAGLRPGLAAAIASTLAYNYYFTAPFRTFAIHSEADIVTVVILFLVAIVSSRLAASLRQQAQLAAAHATRNATIAGFARKLLSARSDSAVAELTVNEMSQLFGCYAVLQIGRDALGPLASTPQSVTLDPSDLAAAAVTLETGEPTGRGEKRINQADWQFHPVSAETETIAALGLARPDGASPVGSDQLELLGSLLDQVALALERVRVEREARDSATLAMKDQIRTALLASIGEDVKPRLIEIATAARALKREGKGEKVLVSTVVDEAVKLERYIDNLVDLNPAGDSAPLQFGPVAIDLHMRKVLCDGAEVHLTPKEFAVLAELAKHGGRVLTHAQLLRTVWGPAQQDHVDYLRVAISALRHKLEDSAADPVLIVNEPGVGYRLTTP